LKNFSKLTKTKNKNDKEHDNNLLWNSHDCGIHTTTYSTRA